MAQPSKQRPLEEILDDLELVLHRLGSQQKRADTLETITDSLAGHIEAIDKEISNGKTTPKRRRRFGRR